MTGMLALWELQAERRRAIVAGMRERARARVTPTGPRTADSWETVNGVAVNAGALADFAGTLPKRGQS